MKRWQRWSLIALAVVAAVMLLRATVFRPTAIDVEVVAIGRGVVEDAVTNSQAGTVRSRLRSKLGAERAGRVVQIPYREGASVKRGDVLLELDTSTARTRLDLAQRDFEVGEATLRSAQANFEYASAEYERTKELFDRDVVSQNDMDLATSSHDRSRAELSAAEAGLARARDNVRLARDDLAHMQVIAPYDGLIAQRLVEVGESVVPGQPVLEVVAPDSLYVSARIDEIDIGRLESDLPARITLDPYRGEVWQGRVSRVFPVLDDRLEQNRTLEVEVDLRLEDGRPKPKPGTSADVVIVVDERPDVVRVPTFAVIEGKRVLLAQKGKAVSRSIVTGLRNWEWTEVVEGLAEGDRVITSLDRQGVRDGAAVKAAAQEPEPRVAGADS